MNWISVAGIFGLLLSTLALVQEYAWWATARFEPAGTSVEGFGIEELDPSWIAATILNDAILPEAASEPEMALSSPAGVQMT